MWASSSVKSKMYCFHPAPSLPSLVSTSEIKQRIQNKVSPSFSKQHYNTSYLEFTVTNPIMSSILFDPGQYKSLQSSEGNSRASLLGFDFVDWAMNCSSERWNKDSKAKSNPRKEWAHEGHRALCRDIKAENVWERQGPIKIKKGPA